MGGDEFCIVFESGDDPPDFVVAGAERALREHGEGFDISASYGAVTLPDDAVDVSEALGLADQRMYAQKKAGRLTAEERSTTILLSALSDSQTPTKPTMHLPGVVAFDRGARAEARAAARGGRPRAADGRAARRREDGDPGRDPAQARPAHRPRSGSSSAATR